MSFYEDELAAGSNIFEGEDDALGLTDLGRAVADSIEDVPPCDVQWDAATGVHRCTECDTPFFSLHEIADRVSGAALATIDVLAESAGVEPDNDPVPVAYDLLVIDGDFDLGHFLD